MYSESLTRLPSALKVFISMMTLFCTLIPSESCKKLSLKYNTKRKITNFSSTKGILNFLTRVNFEFARHSDIATRHKAQLWNYFLRVMSKNKPIFTPKWKVSLWTMHICSSLRQTFAPSELQGGKLCRGDRFGLLRSGQQDVNISPESWGGALGSFF